MGEFDPLGIFFLHLKTRNCNFFIIINEINCKNDEREKMQGIQKRDDVLKKIFLIIKNLLVTRRCK